MSDVDQAEGGEEGAHGEEGEGKKGGKKKLLLILVPLILLIGGGAGAYFMGLLDPLLGKAETGEGEHGEAAEGEHGEAKEGGHEAPAEGGHGEAAEGGHGEGGSGAFIEIPTMIINLASEDEEETPRYLRLTVQLEMADPSQRAKVESVIPRVVDQFQTYLRELRVRDLRGSAGIYRLQMELLWRVNQAAAPVEIKDVLFQEILIQ